MTEITPKAPAASTKRRTDYRRVRPTKTYSLPEIAKHLERDIRTIDTWIADGLPTIDGMKPAMVFGHVLKSWLREKWDARRVTCGHGELYCFGCAMGRRPAAGSLVIQKRQSSGYYAQARCCTCNASTFRALSDSDTVIWTQAFLGYKLEVNGFNETYTSPSSVAFGADRSPQASKSAPTSVEVCQEPTPTGRQRRARDEIILPQNPQNERLKAVYFEYLRLVPGRSDLSINKDEISLLKYEKFSQFADFRCFDRAKACAFKQHLLQSPLTSATIVRTMASVKEFYSWLSREPGFIRKIARNDVDYLNIPPRERRRSRSSYSRAVPTLDTINKTLTAMPNVTDLQKRNRALVAFFALSGIRETACIGLKLRHFDEKSLLIDQDPLEVKTKLRKRIRTFLLPFEPMQLEVFLDWISHLKSVMDFSREDPIFPRSEVVADGAFGRRSLSKQHHPNAQMARRAFQSAFVAAGFSAYSPHSCRHMLMAEAYSRNFSIEEIKAISQNLGHGNTAVTFASYGNLPLVKQGKALRDAINSSAIDDINQKDIETVEKLHKTLLRMRKTKSS
jgi:integrase